MSVIEHISQFPIIYYQITAKPVLNNFGIPNITSGNIPGTNSIHETDMSSVSSSKNASPNGATFKEDPHTSSSKASRNVSPTFGDSNDAKWSNRFLDRVLFIMCFLNGVDITARVEYITTIQYA